MSKAAICPLQLQWTNQNISKATGLSSIVPV